MTFYEVPNKISPFPSFFSKQIGSKVMFLDLMMAVSSIERELENNHVKYAMAPLLFSAMEARIWKGW